MAFVHRQRTRPKPNVEHDDGQDSINAHQRHPQPSTAPQPRDWNVLFPGKQKPLPAELTTHTSQARPARLDRGRHAGEADHADDDVEGGESSFTLAPLHDGTGHFSYSSLASSSADVFDDAYTAVDADANSQLELELDLELDIDALSAATLESPSTDSASNASAHYSRSRAHRRPSLHPAASDDSQSFGYASAAQGRDDGSGEYFSRAAMQAAAKNAKARAVDDLEAPGSSATAAASSSCSVSSLSSARAKQRTRSDTHEWSWTSMHLREQLEDERRAGLLGSEDDDDDEDGQEAWRSARFFTPTAANLATARKLAASRKRAGQHQQQQQHRPSAIFTSGSEGEDEGTADEDNEDDAAWQSARQADAAFEAELANTPLAASAGLVARRLPPRSSALARVGEEGSHGGFGRGPLAKGAPPKRRHRRAGLSDKGSKRSYTSASQSNATASAAGWAAAAASSRASREGLSARRSESGMAARRAGSRRVPAVHHHHHNHQARETSNAQSPSTGRRFIGAVLKRVFDVDKDVLDAFLRDEGPLAILDENEQSRARRGAQQQQQDVDAARVAHAFSRRSQASSSSGTAFDHERFELNSGLETPRRASSPPARLRDRHGRPMRMLLDGREILDSDAEADEAGADVEHDEALDEVFGMRGQGLHAISRAGARENAQKSAAKAPLADGGGKLSPLATSPIVLARAASYMSAKRRLSAASSSSSPSSTNTSNFDAVGDRPGLGKRRPSFFPGHASPFEPTTVEALNALLRSSGRSVLQIAQPLPIPLRVLGELARRLGWAVLGFGGGEELREEEEEEGEGEMKFKGDRSYTTGLPPPLTSSPGAHRTKMRSRTNTPLDSTVDVSAAKERKRKEDLEGRIQRVPASWGGCTHPALSASTSASASHSASTSSSASTSGAGGSFASVRLEDVEKPCE